MKHKETYICDGKFFDSYDDVVTYAASINCRVSNTQTVGKNKFLITLSGL